MKKSLLALLSLGTLSGVAHSQSVVTLYGIIDEGLTSTPTLGALTCTTSPVVLYKAAVGGCAVSKI